jgi:hypothetical protein
MKRPGNLDWDAIAGIVAAVVALVLHLLHVVDEDVLLSITLVILAVILLRDIRRENQEERTTAMAERTETAVRTLQAALTPPDLILIGPRHLRAESERFARRARGEMTWFNVCLLMFVPQSLFDVLLRPAIENPAVHTIQFILDEGERERWQQAVLPKVAACAGREKVREPYWRRLEESISFILTETEPSGGVEAYLSFWGEPFMARSPERDVPRYIVHVQPHSDLLRALIEIERTYRLRSQ